MALLALSNAGVPAHFFHLMEAATLRLPNVRMRVYGFVENRTFLEQFVSMGVPAHFFHILVLYDGFTGVVSQKIKLIILIA